MPTCRSQLGLCSRLQRIAANSISGRLKTNKPWNGVLTEATRRRAARSPQPHAPPPPAFLPGERPPAVLELSQQVLAADSNA